MLPTSSPNLKELFKQHLALAYPIILSQLSHVSIVVADNLMVGWLGATPLAAGALANAIFWPFLALGLGISGGMTPLVAAADARGNYRKATQVLKHGLVVNLAFAVFFCAIIGLCSPALQYLGQASEVIKLAQPYLWILAASLIPLMVFQAFKEYTEGLSFTKQVMYINLTCSLVNVVLNYIFIYGKLGCPAMGLNGAGWATLVSRVLMVVLMGVYVFKAPRLRKRNVGFSLKNFVPAYFIKIVQLGLPTGLEFALEAIAYTLAMIMVGWINAEVQAAYIITSNLSSISWIIVWGFGLATTIRVGNQFGHRDFYTLRKVAFVGFTLGEVFMLLASLTFLLGRHVLPGLYTDDSTVLQIAASLSIIVGILQLSDGLGAIGLCALRGIEDTTVPFIIATISYWLLGIPLGYLFCFKLGWGVQGVWWGLGVGKTFSSVSMLVRFMKKSKKLMVEASLEAASSKIEGCKVS